MLTARARSTNSRTAADARQLLGDSGCCRSGTFERRHAPGRLAGDGRAARDWSPAPAGAGRRAASARPARRTRRSGARSCRAPAAVASARRYSVSAVGHAARVISAQARPRRRPRRGTSDAIGQPAPVRPASRRRRSSARGRRTSSCARRVLPTPPAPTSVSRAPSAAPARARPARARGRRSWSATRGRLCRVDRSMRTRSQSTALAAGGDGASTSARTLARSEPSSRARATSSATVSRRGTCASAALQLADAARADTGAFGQLFLGQPGRAPMVAQELAEVVADGVVDRPRRPLSQIAGRSVWNCECCEPGCESCLVTRATLSARLRRALIRLASTMRNLLKLTAVPVLACAPS